MDGTDANLGGVTLPLKAPAGVLRDGAGLPWLSWALLLLAGAIALHPVTPTWDINANYSFGWWIPLVSIFLFIERWRSRPPRQVSGTVRLFPLLLVGGLLFTAFRLAAETDPDWRPGLWILVSLYIAAALGWLWLYGGASWARHFGFPVCFLCLSLPWFFEIEYPLVQGLMRWNAILAATSLRWIAISAEPAGNIIHLQNCDLGVEEACSGILSLQSSVMIGCLLGEIYGLTVRRRIGLVAAAMSLALVGNYLRTLFLALMAFYSGPDAVTSWHDTAGYSILAFTAVGTWLTALALAIGKVPVTPAVQGDLAEEDKLRQTRFSQRLAVGVVVVALLAEGLTQTWFGWKESSLSRHPEWTAQLPASDSYRDLPLSDVTLEALRCDREKSGQWKDAKGWNWTVYWFQYLPKPYTRIVLGWHTPDNCLPSAGLTKVLDYADFKTSANGLDFVIQPKKFVSKDGPVYVFWVVYPNRGDLPEANDTRIPLPVGSKFRAHLQDIWNGYRGVGVETMEVAIAGPPDYDTAKTGFLKALQTISVPGAVH